jgi:putative membrane protein
VGSWFRVLSLVNDRDLSHVQRARVQDGLTPRIIVTRVKRFIQSWLVNTLAVLVAVYIVPGIHYERPLDIVVASLLLGILNAVLRPVLILFALPLVILTLGLFTLLINAFLLYFVANLLRPHFYVDSFGSAFLGALLISFVSLVLNWLSGGGSARVKIERQRRGSGTDHRGGGGPIIDV